MMSLKKSPMQKHRSKTSTSLGDGGKTDQPTFLKHHYITRTGGIGTRSRLALRDPSIIYPFIHSISSLTSSWSQQNASSQDGFSCCGSEQTADITRRRNGSSAFRRDGRRQDRWIISMLIGA